MNLRDRFLAGLAAQLGHPRGRVGHLVARQLNHRNAAVLRSSVTLLAPSSGESVADIGFGGGATLAPLLDRVGATGQVVGLDISDVALARARRDHREAAHSGRLRLLAGSLTQLPLPDAALDAALTTNTVYFVDDLPAAAAELQRVVRPGGRLLIGIGDAEAMRRLPFTASGFRLRPAAEVLDTFIASGFTLTSHERVGTGEGAFHLLLLDRS